MSKHVWQFDTPIALFIFNRPDTTLQVFNIIRAIRPRHLLIVADGPRLNRLEEADLCRESRLVVNGIDWYCNVDINFASVNLGCKQRVSSGLDWVFNQVEEAIILEDDCLPDKSFFPFCQQLLEKYRNEYKIAQISGVNFQFGRLTSPFSYYFSRYNHIWGWASWRRSWEIHDQTMNAWPDFRDRHGLDKMLSNKSEVSYWIDVFNRVYSGEIDTWDCGWTFTCWQHGLLSVIPSVNLVSNIGFRPDATHTPVPNRYASMKTGFLNFPLVHPIDIGANCKADDFTGKTMFREPSFVQRFFMALREIKP